MRRYCLVLATLCWSCSIISAFVVVTPRQCIVPSVISSRVTLRSSKSSSDSTTPNNNDDNNNKDESITRTSFDQAGASLVEEEDRKRLEEMGDFDTNPAYQDDSIERMRAAVRARTANLGIEKSKVTAEYVQKRQQQAIEAGSAQQDRERQQQNVFGGVDLSQISSTSDNVKNRGQWDEDLPTMFYDPEEEMTMEERQQVDPVMTKNILEQAMNELNSAKWPNFAAAGREVVIMAIVVVFSMIIIIGSDNLLRTLYTALGFIPSPEDLANYATRFDGLDLPAGWMNNMNEQDVAKLAEQVNAIVPKSSGLPEL